jgi:hypothetical protein
VMLSLVVASSLPIPMPVNPVAVVNLSLPRLEGGHFLLN